MEELPLVQQDPHRVMTRAEIRHKRKQEKRANKKERIGQTKEIKAKTNKISVPKRNANTAKDIKSRRQINQARGQNH
jgi:hypothetical protein